MARASMDPCRRKQRTWFVCFVCCDVEKPEASSEFVCRDSCGRDMSSSF